MIQTALLTGCQNPSQHDAVTQLESTDRESGCTIEDINVSVHVSSHHDQSIISFGTRPVADYNELRRLLQMAREDWLKTGVSNPIVTLSVAKDVPWSEVFDLITAIQKEGISRIEFRLADSPR